MARKINGGKLYRTISSIAITGIFVAIAVLVFALMGFFTLSSFLFGLVFTIAVLCLSLISTLPWVKRIEDGELKKVSMVFLTFIGITAVLWIIAVWMGVTLYNKTVAAAISEKEVMSLLLFMKIVTITSAQLIISSAIGNTVLKFKKTMYPLQVVTYLSYAFVDFYLIYLLTCIQIDPNASQTISVASGITLLGNRWMITFLILSIIFMGVSTGIIRAIDNRRMKNFSESLSMNGEVGHFTVVNEEASSPKESVEDKLAKLKDLYDKELITKEEYEQKKQDLMKDL